jgi:hypothetical protein
MGGVTADGLASLPWTRSSRESMAITIESGSSFRRHQVHEIHRPKFSLFGHANLLGERKRRDEVKPVSASRFNLRTKCELSLRASRSRRNLPRQAESIGNIPPAFP